MPLPFRRRYSWAGATPAQEERSQPGHQVSSSSSSESLLVRCQLSEYRLVARGVSGRATSPDNPDSGNVVERQVQARRTGT
jgi:hypothetical protein